MGPMIDHVVVLLIEEPPTTPNPWSAQSTPKHVTTIPTARMAMRIPRG